MPTQTLGIDPSTTCLGWAFFRGDSLEVAGVVEAEDMDEMIAKLRQAKWPDCNRLVIEKMQIYARRPWEPMINISILSGILLQSIRWDRVSLPYPRDWKGQVPKTIHNQRIIASLDQQSRDRLDLVGVPAGKKHNVIDAIGLAKWGIQNEAV